MVIIFLFGYYKVTFLNTFVREITRPVFGSHSVIVRPFFAIKDYFVSKNDLLSKNEEQQNEIEELKLSILKQKISTIENQERFESQNSHDESENVVVAKVLLRPPYSPYDTLTISVGQKDGIQTGQKVFTKNTFIGFVKEASSNTSIVELISSSKFESVVRISNETDATSVGTGGGRLVISLPKDIKVERGDVIYMPDFTSSLVGVVSEIEVQENDSFQIIHFNLPVPLSKILFVEVVIE